MSSATYTKDPQAVLDYVFDWTTWLQNGEVIVTSQMYVSNTSANGLSVGAVTNDYFTATVWLGAGMIGRVYQVVNTITTDQGRTNVRSMNIRVADR